ncbi:MAG: DNA primase [Flavobacterium sp. SCGC AAA160-P02]|nr:MAG: DNA primase [Flavobacterium sp. SCGC AAA160-P02]
MISRSTIDRVFETARVEEVIGEFVQLKKAGSNFKGLSPFSDEKTPSFMVSPVKQIWKDFSTGKGGNAVSFLMEHEHYSYPEAIKFLAKKYNIEIEETLQTDEQKEKMNERESMFLVSNFAKDYFHDVLLNSTQGKSIGLTYFRERGFREETIKRFDLGYCLDQWDTFTKEALQKGYDLKYLVNTGLTIDKEKKQFDRFKGRVLFPIHSMSGRVLGFGGRTLSSDKKTAKYVNSPESDIYHKSKILYGIYHAKQQIAKQDNCYLVEGYTDVISLYQSGVENVVASSGTALTSDQIRLINRLTKNITVLFDGDAAGIRASIRGIDLILEQGMNVKVVAFPDGEDPDSFAKKKSDEALKNYLEDSAQDFINFKVSLLMKQANNDPVKKAGLIRDIVTSISKIPDSIQREIYVQECSRIMDVSERVLFSELAQIISKKIKDSSKIKYKQEQSFDILKKQTEQVDEIDSLFILEKEIIRILLLFGNQETDFIDFIEVKDDQGMVHVEKETYTNQISKEMYLNLQEDEVEFSNEIFRSIYYEMIHQLNQVDKIEIDAFINHPNSKISEIVTSVLMDDEKYTLSDWERKKIFVSESEEVLSKLVTDAILNLRRVLIDKKIEQLINPDINSSVEKTDLELIQNYTELKKRLYSKLMRVV